MRATRIGDRVVIKLKEDLIEGYIVGSNGPSEWLVQVQLANITVVAMPKNRCMATSNFQIGDKVQSKLQNYGAFVGYVTGYENDRIVCKSIKDDFKNRTRYAYKATDLKMFVRVLTKKEELQESYKVALAKGYTTFTLYVQLPNGTVETIITSRCMEDKLQYVEEMYKDDLKHKRNPKVQITGWMFE